MAASGELFIGGINYFKAGIRMKGGPRVFSGSGAPVNGTAVNAGKGSIYVDYAGGVAYMNTGTKASPTWLPYAAATQSAVAQSQPANPTGTTSTTAVMMGLAGALTPVYSTRVEVTLCGDIATGTTTDGAVVQLSYGTGTAPANAAALTGTQVGAAIAMTGVTNILSVPFSATAIITGLTAGTAYWFDAALKAVTGGTASISNLSLSICEL